MAGCVNLFHLLPSSLTSAPFTLVFFLLLQLRSSFRWWTLHWLFCGACAFLAHGSVNNKDRGTFNQQELSIIIQTDNNNKRGCTCVFDGRKENDKRGATLIHRLIIT
ncbi:hypothetical protein F5H01DRAFT_348181 [Linnemannia elongata]|nr:hypothetical protein F5H01DRAFT_348181 [Linnemannia elongata]